MKDIDRAQDLLRGYCPYCHQPEEHHDTLNCDFMASKVQHLIEYLVDEYERTGKIDKIEYGYLEEVFNNRRPSQ